MHSCISEMFGHFVSTAYISCISEDFKNVIKKPTMVPHKSLYITNITYLNIHKIMYGGRSRPESLYVTQNWNYESAALQ